MMKILIVEDEVNLLNTLSRVLLNEMGAHTEIELCRTAELAWKKLEAEAYDLLISDWHLPGMSGFQLILKARKAYPDLKIIFMTAYVCEEIVEKAKAVADVCFFKPFPIPKLLENIRALT
jgi:DNA-binding response OmpR family regulator